MASTNGQPKPEHSRFNDMSNVLEEPIGQDVVDDWRAAPGTNAVAHDRLLAATAVAAVLLLFGLVCLSWA